MDISYVLPSKLKYLGRAPLALHQSVRAINSLKTAAVTKPSDAQRSETTHFVNSYKYANYMVLLCLLIIVIKQ